MPHQSNPRPTLVVFSTISAKEALIELVPAFERIGACRVEITYTPAPSLVARLRSGLRGDLFIGPEEYSGPLTDEGILLAGTRMPFARSTAGLAVRAGAAKPDISTPEHLKRTLLAAHSVSYSEGASGQMLLRILDRLEIRAAVTVKLVLPRPGEQIGDVIARGGADLGVQQISALLPVEGIDIVDRLPAELQEPLIYGATLFQGTLRREAARAFVDFLRSDVAPPILRRKGLEPA